MTTPAAPLPSSPEADAARYAVLRRLAPSMRHHLVVNQQPIGRIYEVKARRLRSPAPVLGLVHDSAVKINSFAKAALAACIDVVGWLGPDEGAGISVPDAMRECSGLLATSLSFRGYALRTAAEPLAGQVRRSAIRHLLTASILHCTDHAAPPAELMLAARSDADAARVELTIRPTEGDAVLVTEHNYRKITWSDLEALAAVDGVQLARTEQGLVLRLPWLTASAA